MAALVGALGRRVHACTHSYFEDWSGGGQLGVRGGSEGARAFDIAGLWLALRADSMTCGRSGQRHCRFSPLQEAAPAEALISRVGRCRLQSRGAADAPTRLDRPNGADQ